MRSPGALLALAALAALALLGAPTASAARVVFLGGPAQVEEPAARFGGLVEQHADSMFAWMEAQMNRMESALESQVQRAVMLPKSLAQAFDDDASDKSVDGSALEQQWLQQQGFPSGARYQVWQQQGPHDGHDAHAIEWVRQQQQQQMMTQPQGLVWQEEEPQQQQEQQIGPEDTLQALLDLLLAPFQMQPPCQHKQQQQQQQLQPLQGQLPLSAARKHLPGHPQPPLPPFLRSVPPVVLRFACGAAGVALGCLIFSLASWACARRRNARACNLAEPLLHGEDEDSLEAEKRRARAANVSVVVAAEYVQQQEACKL